ncbi:dihydroorotase [Buchnera aphidicola]|uniref:dihydroorotase n=1 Tax=Buchnera aphidicola TaxID=9 RepID=UPI003BEEF6ED
MSKFFKKITIIKPDDWHVHLRENTMLSKVINYTGIFYERAIIMPNLENPIINCKQSINYRKQILQAQSNHVKFQPLMTCYLTDFTKSKELEIGFNKKIFIAAKLYPKNSTTNSQIGIKNINNIYSILEIMEKIGMPLLIHGEETDHNIDIYDREAKFLETTLEPIQKKFPSLKIVLEHITTKESVDYVIERNSPYLAATITPHHLILNRNHMFENGINPYLYCLPILKRKIHQTALRNAISSGNKSFFLGSDTAPHYYKNKINITGCAGIFNAPSSLLIYATVFEEMQALQHFQSFCSENGPKFYNLPINEKTITLIRKPHKIIDQIKIGKNTIIPFLAGQILNWSIDI